MAITAVGDDCQGVAASRRSSSSKLATSRDQGHQVKAEFAIVVVERDYTVLGDRHDVDTRDRDRRGDAGFVRREHPDLADQK